MAGIDQALADELLSSHLDFLRFDAGTRARVINILNRLQLELTAKLASADLTVFNKARTQAFLNEINAVIDRYYAMVQGELNTAMGAVTQAAASHTVTTLQGLGIQLGVGLPTQTFLERLASNILIMGTPASDWVEKQGLDVAFRFATALRMGVSLGETTEQIVARIAGSPRKGITGIMDIARSNARAVVHTSIQSVANAARIETFERNMVDVADLLWLGTLDPHTCLLCIARDMHTYAMGSHDALDGGPPWGLGPGNIHFSCRCVASLSMHQLEGMPKLPIGGRASSTGPVAGNTSFSDYLDRMGKDWQDRVLGPGRAALWRANKLTLEQLLSFSGNPISLSDLRKKYS